MKNYIPVFKLILVAGLWLCVSPAIGQGSAQTNFQWPLFIFLGVFTLIILLLAVIMSIKTKEIIYKSRKKIDKNKRRMHILNGMKETKDIMTLDDIRKLVDTFYEKVRQDALLAPIFNERIQNGWPQHLEKMYAFWQTLLLNERTYYASPFPKHAQLQVNHSHFQKWMELFITTVEMLFKGEKANEAKLRAMKIAQIFETKIEYNRNHQLKDPL
jgi:hemoglobin